VPKGAGSPLTAKRLLPTKVWRKHWQQHEADQSDDGIRIVESHISIPRQQHRDRESGDHFGDAIYV